MIASKISGSDFSSFNAPNTGEQSSFSNKGYSKFLHKLSKTGRVSLRRPDIWAYDCRAPRAARLPSWKPNCNTRNQLGESLLGISGVMPAGAIDSTQSFKTTSSFRASGGVWPVARVYFFSGFKAHLSQSIHGGLWETDWYLKGRVFLLAAREGRSKRGS